MTYLLMDGRVPDGPFSSRFRLDRLLRLRNIGCSHRGDLCFSFSEINVSRSISFSLELRDVKLEVTVDQWEDADESVGIFGATATCWELSDAATGEVLDWELTDGEVDQLQEKFSEVYSDDHSEE